MEPPVALADYRDGKVTVWAPVQNPQAVQETISEKMGIPKEAVTCYVTLLGGGFGRKSKPDFAAEAAILSKKTGRPVKVVWSREDDIRFDYFHSVAAMQRAPKLVALRIVFHFAGGAGGFQRNFPRGGAAYGIPRYALTVPRLLPCTIPLSIFTSGLAALAAIAVTNVTAPISQIPDTFIACAPGSA